MCCRRERETPQGGERATTMSILIEGATIVAMDPEHGSEPFQGDILIEGERIAAIGDAGEEVRADRVIEGAGKLVIPGLVNGHIHTPEAFAKGRYDNMPLELWMTLAYGILGAAELTPRMIYLRSALCAMDAIKTGRHVLLRRHSRISAAVHGDHRRGVSRLTRTWACAPRSRATSSTASCLTRSSI